MSDSETHTEPTVEIQPPTRARRASLKKPDPERSDAELQAWESLLARRAAEYADARIVRREARWRSAVGVLLVVVTGFGFINMSGLREDIEARTLDQSRAMIEKRVGEMRSELQTKIVPEIRKDLHERVGTEVRAEVASIVDQRVKVLGKELAVERSYFQLFNLAAEIADPERKSFTNSERDAAVSLIDRIVGPGTPGEVAQRPEFAQVAEQILDAFIGAGLIEYVDDVEHVVRPIAVMHSGLAFALMRHYAVALLGNSDPPDDHRQRFALYREAMVRHKYPELALLYRAARDFVAAGLQRSPATVAALEDIKGLSAKDRAAFVHAMDFYRRDGVEEGDSNGDRGGLMLSYHRRFGKRMRAFVAAHPEQIAEIRAGIPAGAESPRSGR